METQNYYTKFLTGKQMFLKKLENKYFYEVGKVKNKEKAHKRFWFGFLAEEIRWAYDILKHNMGFLDKVHRIDDDEIGLTYDEIFNSEFDNIKDVNKKEVLNRLAYVAACEDCRKFWNEQDKQYRNIDNEFLDITDSPVTLESEKEERPQLIWKGNETEFMQLIYGLYCAGYLDNTEEHITKLAPQFAKLIYFKLGKNPDSNLSKNIHRTKSPVKIFDNMKMAFEAYANNLKQEKDERQ